MLPNIYFTLFASEAPRTAPNKERDPERKRETQTEREGERVFGVLFSFSSVSEEKTKE
jgi:hypothetical protein